MGGRWLEVGPVVSWGDSHPSNIMVRGKVIRTEKCAPEQNSAPGSKKALPGADESAPGSTFAEHFAEQLK
jgi:hypothetical protein